MNSAWVNTGLGAALCTIFAVSKVDATTFLWWWFDTNCTTFTVAALLHYFSKGLEIFIHGLEAMKQLLPTTPITKENMLAEGINSRTKVRIYELFSAAV
jgi:hypothetical protein